MKGSQDACAVAWRRRHGEATPCRRHSTPALAGTQARKRYRCVNVTRRSEQLYHRTESQTREQARAC